MKIAVIIFNGNVQVITSEAAEVLTIDTFNEGIDKSQLKTIDGDDVQVHLETIQANPEKVERLFAQAKQ